jgi:hypothetical protein
MNTTHSSRCSFRSLGKTTGLFACLLVAAALAGCSSVKTQVDKGPIKARTFSFLNTGSRSVPDFAEDRKEAHTMIQQALTKNLAAKGVSYVATGGDITVAYLVVLGNNVATTSLNDYFGYTPDSQALMDKVHAEQTSKDQSRGYFESGTLVVDILDPSSTKLLQRRSIQAPVLRNLPTEKRVERVQSIVDQTLHDVSISQ